MLLRTFSSSGAFSGGTGPRLLLFLLLLLFNLAVFLIYGLDKRKAKRGSRRISEKTLLLLAVFGGSVGAWLGMRLFHHKTRHWYFRFGIPAIFLAELALLLYVLIR